MRVLLLGDERIIDITSQEQYESVALVLVKARFDGGYYPEPQAPIEPNLSKKAGKKALPPGVFLDHFNAVWKRYADDKARYDKEFPAWQSIKECVETGNGVAAIAILTARKDYRGEEIQVFEVSPTY